MDMFLENELQAKRFIGKYMELLDDSSANGEIEKWKSLYEEYNNLSLDAMLICQSRMGGGMLFPLEYKYGKASIECIKYIPWKHQNESVGLYLGNYEIKRKLKEAFHGMCYGLEPA